MIKYGLMSGAALVLARETDGQIQSQKQLNDEIAREQSEINAEIYKYRHFSDESKVTFGYDSNPSWSDRIKNDIRDEEHEIEREI